MKIGFIGLGKMGGNMSKRLVSKSHEVLAYDPSGEARMSAVQNGIAVAESKDEFLEKNADAPIWLMIPAEYVDQEIEALLAVVSPHTIIIDGGNSDFRLSKVRAEKCLEHDVAFIDVGTSGGILGLENGYSMMVGGDESSVQAITPVLNDLAPTDGWHYFGESGSGHYVKMVHNAIEYGLMESYAEGYRLLKEGPYTHIDLAEAGKVWQHGSIIESLLNNLSAQVLTENPSLDGVVGTVHESGEARWALEVARDHNVEMPAIRTALEVRNSSQNGAINFATKLLAEMRNKFGGHAINQDKS